MPDPSDLLSAVNRLSSENHKLREAPSQGQREYFRLGDEHYAHNKTWGDELVEAQRLGVTPDDVETPVRTLTADSIS